MKKGYKLLTSFLLTICVIFFTPYSHVSAATNKNYTLDTVPAYKESPYIEINGNVPYFTKADYKTTAFEKYSNLDKLGRCGVAYANICKELMPTESRGSIGMIKPSGWQTVRYDGIVDGNYLYNRCHLIGFQLAGENANERNLITGTRYMNVEGMLPFENIVADYVNNTNNHVLYRVTPVFKDKNLVALGVQMEAYSVEDKGKGVCFNVYCYNAQPNIEIDYSNGNSRLSDTSTAISISINYSQYALKVSESKTLKVTVLPDSANNTISWYSSNNKVAKVNNKGKVTAVSAGTAVITAKTSNGLKARCTITVKDKNSSNVLDTSSGSTYILNTNTKKFHYPTCSSVSDMKEKNKQIYTGNREDIIDMGYTPCKRCNP